LVLMPAEAFAHQASEAVASYRAWQLALGDNQAESRSAQVVLKIKQREVTRGASPSAAQDSLVLRG
jgi:hypothetical protein